MEREQMIREANNKIFNSKSYIDKHKQIPVNNLIFVYTPPKVGSTTLVSSIRISASHLFTVFHIHDEIMLNVLTGINNVTINELIEYNAKIGKNVYVIDVYRTPIERKISEFFEKIGPIHFNNSEENLNNYNIDLVLKRFNSLFPYIGNGDYYSEKYNLILPKSFDFENKYLYEEVNGVKYIKLRLKDSKEWGSILTKILGTEIYIINQYKTEDKSIGQLFRRFKQIYRLPINFYENIKHCKYLNYYYSNSEKQNYLNEWLNKITEHFDPFTVNEYQFYLKFSIENKYYNDFQTEHYTDYGCLCRLCSKKRSEILDNVKKGIVIYDKINHNQLVNNDLQSKAYTIININNKINNKTTNKFNNYSVLNQTQLNKNNEFSKKLQIKNLMIR